MSFWVFHSNTGDSFNATPNDTSLHVNTSQDVSIVKWLHECGLGAVNSISSAFHWGRQPPKIVPPLWTMIHLMHVLGPPESVHKRYLDRYSRFCRPHERDHQTDKHTDRQTTLLFLFIAIGRYR